MAKHTKASSGAGKRKYFRDALRADPGVSPEAAERLTDKFDAELTHLRVRKNTGTANASAETFDEAEHEADAVPAFDPHAFSLIVVMTKQGAAGLDAKLKAIDNAEHLRALARAQHVAIDGTVSALPDLRAAIIAGTAQRIADRRAAAS
jgi:hypothetical protein